HFLLRSCLFSCSRASTTFEKESVKSPSTTSANYSSRSHLSRLFSDGRPSTDGYNVELVDQDTWPHSLGLAQAWRGPDRELETKPLPNVVGDDCTLVEGDLDFNEIDNMRIRGNLFYKLDRNSKEFEEYSFDFHRKKCSNKKSDRKESENKDDHKEGKKEKRNCNSVFESKNLPKIVNDKKVYTLLNTLDSNSDKKKLRAPTFNQLTGPYHQPFCLDIYISKASVRACIVHRVTSKVVAVAHSISKDMKFDLASTRNQSACAAVGSILAQRALADDIHDVTYTPRKGEKLEGKLQIVLQSIIDHGVNVKVKLKQRISKK
ncbi:Ribosomal_L18p domain-containing protein, partial [Cephalotus follicularis]